MCTIGAVVKEKKLCRMSGVRFPISADEIIFFALRHIGFLPTCQTKRVLWLSNLSERMLTLSPY